MKITAQTGINALPPQASNLPVEEIYSRCRNPSGAYPAGSQSPVLCLHLQPDTVIEIKISHARAGQVTTTLEQKVDAIMALDQATKDLALKLVADAETNRVNMIAVLAKFEELKNGATAEEVAALVAQLTEISADTTEVKTGIATLVTAVPELPNPPVEDPPVEDEGEAL